MGIDMKKIALVTLVSLGMLSMNAFADSDAYNGFSLAYVQSRNNGLTDSTSGLGILRSVRLNEHYGYEMQFGLFGNIGPYTSNGFVELSAIGFVPLSDRDLKLYGKAGLADVYSRGSETANKLGLTYGAGIEFPRDIGKVRVGFQQITVGKGTLSPSRSTYLIGLTLFLK
jgi:opacity protein-like surface antigen